MHSSQSVKNVHSAQLLKLFSKQQRRILHQVARLFSLQPEHFLDNYLSQAPQYNPHLATNFCIALLFGTNTPNKLLLFWALIQLC